MLFLFLFIIIKLDCLIFYSHQKSKFLKSFQSQWCFRVILFTRTHLNVIVCFSHSNMEISSLILIARWFVESHLKI